jgi:hypothetical protein
MEGHPHPEALGTNKNWLGAEQKPTRIPDLAGESDNSATEKLQSANFRGTSNMRVQKRTRD